MRHLINTTATRHHFKEVVSVLAMGLFTATADAADLTVTVSSIEQAAGEIMLAIYDNENDFQKTAKQASRRDAVIDEVKFQFPDLATGNYAILVFQDINGNGKLDSNLLGMPTEPWGASLQGKRIFGAPDWKDTSFAITDSGTAITIELN